MERLHSFVVRSAAFAAVGAVAITAASAATGMQHTALGSPLVGAYSTYAGALGGPYSLVLRPNRVYRVTHNGEDVQRGKWRLSGTSIRFSGDKYCPGKTGTYKYTLSGRN